jgi:hypothetical protein
MPPVPATMPPVPPLPAGELANTPLTDAIVGRELLPAALAQNPTVVVHPAAMDAREESGTRVMVLPDVVCVAPHTLFTCDWFMLIATVQLVVGALPEFFTETFAQ